MEELAVLAELSVQEDLPQDPQHQKSIQYSIIFQRILEQIYLELEAAVEQEEAAEAEAEEVELTHPEHKVHLVLEDRQVELLELHLLEQEVMHQQVEVMEDPVHQLAAVVVEVEVLVVVEAVEDKVQER